MFVCCTFGLFNCVCILVFSISCGVIHGFIGTVVVGCCVSLDTGLSVQDQSNSFGLKISTLTDSVVLLFSITLGTTQLSPHFQVCKITQFLLNEYVQFLLSIICSHIVLLIK
jgi:hypothetical protein